MPQPRVLVTGASGFVGSHAVVSFAEAGFAVIAAGGRRECPQEVRARSSAVISLDIADEAAVEAAVLDFRPEAIVHAAGFGTVPVCEEDPEAAERVNIGGCRHLLRASRKLSGQRPPRVLLLSTDLVFEGTTARPGGLTEQDAPAPVSVYARTKLEAEREILEAGGVALRISLVYGRSIGGRAGFLGWLQGGLERGENVNLFVDEWRTPVFSNDVCRCLRSLVQMDLAGTLDSGPLLFHLGGPERISRHSFGLKLAEEFGYAPELVVPVSRRDFPAVVPRPEDVSLCSAAICRAVGITLHSPQEGLKALHAEMRR